MPFFLGNSPIEIPFFQVTLGCIKLTAEVNYDTLGHSWKQISSLHQKVPLSSLEEAKNSGHASKQILLPNDPSYNIHRVPKHGTFQGLKGHT